MASKFSISTKQAVLAGLGVAALVTGIVVAIRAGNKKKKRLQKPRNTNVQNTKSVIV